ncbi:MAG: DUF2784 domain-containing protein [Deltaproteobacteria bacterium]|nr:MAG: DUF2784 domain-containing protein [Deltaproteobacteria bacterium]
MIYRFLADLTIVLHSVWILFLIFGFILALIRPKIAFLHVAGLLFAMFLNIMGWYCPLTYLENYLYSLDDSPSTYTGPFIMNYLNHLIYPDLPEKYIRIGDILFLCLYLIGYAYLAKRYHILKRIRGKHE